MPENSELALSELICTRLCHDIIGPVGAMSNGVELLEDCDADFLEDIRGLLSASSSSLTGKLKMFRTVFGVSKGNGENPGTINALIDGYLSSVSRKNADILYEQKIPLGWFVEENGALWNKILLSLIIIVCDCLPRGGFLSIIEASNNSIKFSAKSNGVCMIDDVRNAFDSKDDFSRATPKNAPVFLAFVMAEKAGLKIDFDATDASLTFCISK